MSVPNANRAVTLSLIGSVAIVTIATLSKGGSFPKPRVYIGGGFAFMVLAALAAPLPEVAAPLAILIFVSTALTQGTSAFNALSSAEKKNTHVPVKLSQGTPNPITEVTGGTTPGVTGGSAPQLGSIAIGPVLSFARAQLGKPYRFGGAGPDVWDCSGLVMMAYAQINVRLPHNALAQYSHGFAVSRANLLPGDLVFFESLDHVGMYLGDGQVIEAPHTGDVVKIVSLDAISKADGYYGARRLVK